MRACWQLWVVVLSACGHAAPAPTSADDSSTPAYDPNAPRTTLTGLLQIKPADQCGGAAPPPDYEPPPLAPAPGIELSVRPGGTYRGGTPVAEMVTADDGTFTTELPAGTYCITLLADRGERPTRGSKYVDLACLVALWERCDLVITMPESRQVALNHHEPCAGLVCYSGPPPP